MYLSVVLLVALAALAAGQGPAQAPEAELPADLEERCPLLSLGLVDDPSERFAEAVAEILESDDCGGQWASNIAAVVGDQPMRHVEQATTFTATAWRTRCCNT